MTLLRTRLLILIGLVLSAGAESFPVGSAWQDAEPGYEAKLSFSVPEKRPLLVEVENSLKGKLTVSTYAGGQRFALHHEQQTTFIDEYQILTKGQEKATRYFIEARGKTNGEISDGVLTGMEAHFARKEDNVEMELGGNRAALDRDLDWLLNCFDSLGIWLDFPSSAKVGGTVTVDLLPLAPVISCGDMVCKTAQAKLTLDSYDKLTAVARLSGSITMTEGGYLEGMWIEVEIDGTCSLVADVADRRIRSLDVDAAFKLTGTGGMDCDGSGKFHVTLKTEVGDAVEQARWKRPKFRKKLYRLPELGIQVKLPAYYTRLNTDPPEILLARTKDFDKGVAYIELDLLDSENLPVNFFLDKLEGALKVDYPGLMTQKSKCPLGRGRAFFIKSSGDEGTGRARAMRERGSSARRSIPGAGSFCLRSSTARRGLMLRRRRSSSRRAALSARSSIERTAGVLLKTHALTLLRSLGMA